MSKDFPLRGTGQSAACLLDAISNALKHPNQWVGFEDHYSDDKKSHREIWLSSMKNLIQTLGFKMDVMLSRAGRVNVRSNIGDNPAVPGMWRFMGH